MPFRMKLCLLVTLTLLITTVSSCTRKKPKSVPPPPSVAAPPAATVEPPRDFVAETPEDDVTSEDLAELNARAQREGWIRDVFFDYDSSQLTRAAQDGLYSTAAWLRENGRYKLLIEGHCDERGTAAYNLALGDRRANIVRDYLIQLGIDPVRLRTISYGEERPPMEGSGDEVWRMNRRARLVIESSAVR